MAAAGIPTGVETLCHRYGPSRLPGADRPAIGTGYAFATAALFSTVVWVFLAGGVRFVIGVDALLHQAAFELGGIGGLTALFFVPAAFLSGALAHVLGPERLRRHGAFSGALAMVGAYVVGALLVGVALSLAWGVNSPADLLGLAVSVGGAAFLLSGWLSLPVGAAVGHVHQRTVGGSSERGVAWRIVNTVRGYAASYFGPASDRVVDGWARYGPSRLPGGDRPAIGAGYALATAAGALTLVIYGGPALLGDAVALRWLAVAVATVAPVAFAAGALAWSGLPDGLPYRGVIAGTSGMAATSLVGASGFHLLAVLPDVAVTETVGFGVFVLLYLGWLSLPVGAAVGCVHERSLDATHTF